VPVSPAEDVVRFGLFELDLKAGQLSRNGTKLRLPQQPLQLLAVLLERPGEVLTREELQQRLWSSDVFVDFDHGLNKSVQKLRDALGDSATSPRYIETIPRVGYRFIAPVRNGTRPLAPEAEIKIPQRPPDRPASLPAVEASTQVSLAVPVPVITRPNWIRLAAVFFALVLAVLALLAWRGYIRSLYRQQPLNAGANSVPRTRTRPITPFYGQMGDPVFSPDGKQIAFTWDGPDHKQPNIYTLPVGGDRPYPVTRFGPEVEHLAWSPDGQTIIYTSCVDKVGGVYAVPALGGPENKLASISCLGAVNGAPQYTADGKSLIVGDICGTTAPLTSAITVLSLANRQKRCLTTPPVRNFDMLFHLSPDGTRVAFVRAPSPNVGDYYVVPITGGEPVRLTKGEIQFAEFMWSSDSSRIIFKSGHSNEFGDRLVSVPAGGGEIKPEPSYHNIGSMSPDGRRVVHVEDNGGENSSIWHALLTAAGGRVIERGKLISSLRDDSPQFSPDGTRIAFDSFRSGSRELWTADADGTNLSQLTFFGGELTGCPRWSPDGKKIAFDRRPGTPAQVWLMDADGRDQHALISTKDDNDVPSWSRDGRSIYFASWRRGDFALLKQRLTPDHRSADGEPVQISRFGGFCGFESYDGRILYFTRRGADGIWSMPTDGGPETRVTSAPADGLWGDWAVTEAGLYMLDCRTTPHCTLEFYNFSTRKVSSLFQIEHEPIAGEPGITASRDGRTVLYTQFTPGQNYVAMTEILP
jgi:Tol biopolymer transport system component/DNA-binding winged helix-turn-helix (wHTH) protein